LRGGDGSDIESAELQLGLHTKQVLGALDERVIQWKAYVPDFEFLENVFLVTGVLDLHVVLKVEGVIVIEVRRDGKLFTDLTGHVHVDLLIEFETTTPLLPNRYRGILNALKRRSKVERHHTAWYEFDVAASEDAVEDGTDKYLWCEAAVAHRALAIKCTGARLPVVLQHRALLILIELIERHRGRRPVRHVADAFANRVVQRCVDLEFQVQPVRIHQEEGRLIGRVREWISVSVGRRECWASARCIGPKRVCGCVCCVRLLSESGEGKSKSNDPGDAESSQSKANLILGTLNLQTY